MKTYQIGAKHTAAMLRHVLRRAFPGVAFSITTYRNRMSGRETISIVYTDGPHIGDVEVVVAPFRRADDYRRDDGCEPLEIEVNDELVRAAFTSDIDVERRYSMDAFTAAVNVVRRRYGITHEVTIRPAKRPLHNPRLLGGTITVENGFVNLDRAVRSVLDNWPGDGPMV